MGAGDTIGSNVRLVREDTEGNQVRILGPFPSDRLDYFNSSRDAEEKLYVNTSLVSTRAKPSGAESVTSRDAVYFPGEILRIEAASNSTSSRSHDYDYDNFAEIDIVVTNRNRNQTYPETLTVQDQELTSNVSESASYYPIFEATVPDRQKWNVAGRFGAVPIEA